MSLTKSSLENPAGVAVGVAIVLLFGAFSLSKLPVQLFPEIERPQMGITTSWRAASPQEIESDILEPQEEVLQGLPGLQEFVAEINQGWCNISLTFDLETDMQQTLVEVISRLNRVPPLPADADPPVVQLGGGGFGGDTNRELIWFYVQRLPNNPKPIESYQKLLEDVVKPRFESVPGVAGVQLMAGAPEEVQIRFDPYRAAEFGIQIPRVAALAGRANDVSGGFVDVGRRKYTLRFAGRYTPGQLEELILDWRDGRPIRLGDIAEIAVARGDRTFGTYQNGNPAMAMRIDRENKANVLQALVDVKVIADELNQGLLAENGLDMQPSFDASVFINRAIALVSGNLAVGVFLAVGVLWWFLRRARATLIVATAIPLSLAGTFIVLNATGRSLNVISLAGLAFAVGMVLDAAIVVLENIVRLREEGEEPLAAAARGTAQVWGALVASTATTVAIFLPVIFLKDVEGQLFADLALTIAIAVIISLLVAITILPTAARKWLRISRLEDPHSAFWNRGARRLVRWTDTPRRRALWIGSLMTVPIAVTILLLPKLDYLPPVKRDAIDGMLVLPPGASIETTDREIAQTIIDRLAPYMRGERQPALRNYYLFTWPGGGMVGGRAVDQSQAGELERLMREEITSGLPDTQAFVFQGDLFGGFSSARSIAFHVQSKDAQALLDAGRKGMELLHQKIPGVTVRPLPGLDLAEPELRLHPDDQRILEVGWSRGQMAGIVRALGDGLYVGEHFDGEKRMNVILRSHDWATPEELEAVPLATPSGSVLQLGELLEVERTVGPTQLRRVDRRRTLTLQINPPDGISLEEALATLQDEVAPQVQALLPADGRLHYGGGADSLRNAVRNLSENFLVALLVLFLLMSALFKSMKDSALVVLALPLATVGGVVALRLMNLVTFQPLDLLTMIGFIILLGLVVNNAILLVHQTRSAERAGLDRRSAVAQALRLRLRPILMSTSTSIFGMLPLVLVPGTGSAIYRGLAVVISGGMMVSTVFTLLLLPCLLRLGEGQRTAAQGDGEGPRRLEPAAA
ncbi:MAG: efflux RND transporter permease subunit [Acidobacteriota bacterium]